MVLSDIFVLLFLLVDKIHVNMVGDVESQFVVSNFVSHFKLQY